MFQLETISSQDGSDTKKKTWQYYKKNNLPARFPNAQERNDEVKPRGYLLIQGKSFDKKIDALKAKKRLEEFKKNEKMLYGEKRRLVFKPKKIGTQI